MRARSYARSGVLTLAACTAAFGQQIGTLRGSLTDATGSAVAGAVVVLEDKDGTKIRETKTDLEGTFSFDAAIPTDVILFIPPYANFAAVSRTTHLSGSHGSIKIALKPDTISQEVNVSSDETLSTDAAANRDAVSIAGADLKRTPIFDQDPIATLTPFLDDASGSSGGVTLIVDGVEVKSATISPSAIQEIRINGDPYSAEYTRPGRGRIEVFSKPGSPHMHGELNFTFRDAIFNAKNHFATVRPPESRRIYEGHLTGPVWRNRRTSFNLSFTHQEQNVAVVVHATTAGGLVTANVLAPNRRTLASARATHDFSDSHRFTMGYTFKLANYRNAGVGGIVLPEAGYTQSSREDDLLISDRLMLTPNLINQLQILLEKDEDLTSSNTDARAVFVSGAFIGGGAQADEHRTENTIHVNEILSWAHGRHNVNAGVQLPQFSRRGVDDATNRLGTLKFSSLGTYAGNMPFVFTVQQGTGRAVYWMNEFGSFLQDQIKINDRTQVTFGLRYDWQTFLGDNNNLAPRVSAAYVFDKGRTVLRLGSGVFYDRTGGDLPAIVKLHDGVTLRAVQIQNPVLPIALGAPITTLPSNLSRFSPQVRSPYSVQYSTGIERKFSKAATVAIEYRGQVQIKAFRSRDANAPILPPNPLLSAVYARPDSRYGQVQDIESGGRSLVNALDISFRGDVSHWFSGQAQYTLASYRNNTGGISMFPQDQYQPNAEWGPADLDRRNKFNLLGNINPGHLVSIGVAATLYSGTPYNETTGDDNYHTGLGNARPIGVDRNTRRGSAVTSFDVLYNHDFHLQKKSRGDGALLNVGVSSFNVFNHVNYTSFIGALSSPNFGQPTAALAGRQMQFSIGYTF